MGMDDPNIGLNNSPLPTTTQLTPEQLQALAATWGIDASQFRAQVDPLLKNNFWSDQNGALNTGPQLTLANGQTWRPSGAQSGITFIPKGTMVEVSPGSYGQGEEGGIYTPGKMEATTEDQWKVGGDLSALIGQEGTNQHTTITYANRDGKMVPVDAPADWTWRSPYADLRKVAATLLPAFMGPAGMLGEFMPAAQLGLEAGSMGAAAINGATMGGVTAGLTGGNIGTGMLMGGAGGALSNAVSPYLTPTPQIGDMGQWYDGYNGLASDGGFAPNGGFTDAEIAQNAGYGANNIDAVDSMLALENANAGYGAFNNDAVDSMLALENQNAGYGAFNDDALDTSLSNTNSTGPLTQTVDATSASANPTDQRLASNAQTTPPSADTTGPLTQTADTTPTETNPTDQRLAAGTQTTPPATTETSLLDSLKNSFYKTNGDLDWAKVLGAAGVASTVLGKLTDGSSDKSVKSIDQLKKDMGIGTGTGTGTGIGSFTPAQMTAFGQPLKAGNQLLRQYAADMPSPIVPGVRYAEGGEVEGPLTQSAPFVGFVQGEGGGQDDLIDASLSAGEYVFDAETVSMLGDGNNTEGARKLDELRAALRAHKRSAPDDEIAPPAAGPLSYMKGGQ